MSGRDPSQATYRSHSHRSASRHSLGNGRATSHARSEHTYAAVSRYPETRQQPPLRPPSHHGSQAGSRGPQGHNDPQRNQGFHPSRGGPPEGHDSHRGPPSQDPRRSGHHGGPNAASSGQRTPSHLHRINEEGHSQGYGAYQPHDQGHRPLKHKYSWQDLPPYVDEDGKVWDESTRPPGYPKDWPWPGWLLDPMAKFWISHPGEVNRLAVLEEAKKYPKVDLWNEGPPFDPAKPGIRARLQEAQMLTDQARNMIPAGIRRKAQRRCSSSNGHYGQLCGGANHGDVKLFGRSGKIIMPNEKGYHNWSQFNIGPGHKVSNSLMRKMVPYVLT